MLITTVQRHGARGFTIVELMVGLVVAMVILLGASKMYINTSESSKNALRATRLNQDMRAVMDLIVSDLRRAGYWANSDAGTCNTYTYRSGVQADNSFCPASITTVTDIFVASDCVLYSYDYDRDGLAPASEGEFFGFYLDGTTVKMLKPGTAVSDTSTSCASVDEDEWMALTDPNAITVTALTFSTAGSQCVNVVSGASWTVNAAEVVAACEASNSTATGYTSPGTNDDLVENRVVTVTLTAQHAQDPFLTRTLTETVQVRANRAIIN